MINNQTELLLPVGTKEMALAAIHGGANAIFVGVPGFNARGRSQDFTIEELREIIALCHLYGVKVNLAFNVVIFESEINSVIEVLKKILPLRPDALIVQDLGLAQLIRSYSRHYGIHQRIHASTQMSITNHEAITLLADLDIQRFVLGRENSMAEMENIRKNTAKELEVFVHGALCVSYSGQCFTSESFGGRSANRGQCAQSCRLSYTLFVDGIKKELGARKFLVSPQDLCGLSEIPRLLEIGINSFKVEGRLKTPDYVASSAQAYRTAIDFTEAEQLQTPQMIKESIKKMATTYSRGFFSGWLNGVNHQSLVEGTFSSNRGYEFGKIVGLGEHCVQIEIVSQSAANKSEMDLLLAPGDGLLWAYEHQGATIEQGGFIYSVEEIEPKIFQIGLATDLKLSSYCIGARVFLNHDKNQKRDLAQLSEDKNRKRREPINIEVKIELGKPLIVVFEDDLSNIIQRESKQIVVEAKTKGTSDLQIQEELSALTGSPFRVNNFRMIRLTDVPIFIANREIKELRQILTQLLIELRTQILPMPNLTNLSLSNISDTNRDSKSSESSERINIINSNLEAIIEVGREPKIQPKLQRKITQLNILLRKKEQVEDLIDGVNSNLLVKSEIALVILDFEFGRDYLTSIELLKKNGFRTGLATTRILKPTEYKNLNILVSMEPSVILVRNLGALQYLTENLSSVNPLIELMGDFSLNVTNSLSAAYLLKKGLKSLCVSYDLNKKQVSELLQNAYSQPYVSAQHFEVTVHQYMPSFHMEHCVFAAFLSQGKSWRDCGKPCEKHQVQLMDQFGHLHEIKADQECRNTMYNAQSQSAGRFIEEWTNLGLGSIRYEALNERTDDLITKISAYADYIHSRIDFNKLKEILGSIESYGLSEGQLGKTHEYQNRKKN